MDLIAGLLVAIPIAYCAARVGRLTAAGAAAGVIVAGIVYAGFLLAGYAVLAMALVSTIAASRIRERSPSLASPERRGAGNILANCSVGTMAALLEVARRGELGFSSELVDLHPDVLSLWFVTAIAAGASDTVASEIGQAFAPAPRSVLSWQIVPPGTPGAVSLAGLLAGITAAAIIAMPAAGLWLIPWRDLALVIVACTAGAMLESLVAANYESRGMIGSHALNVINTAAAGVVAVLLK
jgi:uncharacterized protein (TIGR00297 family)